MYLLWVDLFVWYYIILVLPLGYTNIVGFRERPVGDTNAFGDQHQALPILKNISTFQNVMTQRCIGVMD